MSRSMDKLTVRWEGVLPRKDIEMLREAELVEILPQSHLVEIPLQRNCPAVALVQVFPRRRKSDTHRFHSQ
jgi:hypothetical protein